jgi:hypothetical protein
VQRAVAPEDRRLADLEDVAGAAVDRVPEQGVQIREPSASPDLALAGSS